MNPGDIVADRFVIEALADEGGMGVVYRARDRVTGERVALKVLLEGVTHARRFVREARMLAAVQHPAIVGYVAHGETLAGLHYLAMAWLDGEDLAAHLARARMPLTASFALVSRVASALDALHARGIIHRDLKPRNIFLPGGDPARATVLDFGIARDVDPDAALTRTGTTLGSPGYLAPEQARGERALSPSVDVFALGCVWFECVTGRAPFRAESPMAMLARVLFEDTPRALDVGCAVPDDVDALLARMLARDPSARPRDGAALVRELAALAPIHDGPAGDAGPSPRAITAGEQRLFCVVAAALSADAPTLVGTHPVPARSDLAAVARAFGGRVEVLADGSLVVAFATAGLATDQVTCAARCALALQAQAGDIAFALATGWGQLSKRTLVGEVIDRAIALALTALPAGPLGRRVRLDAMSEGLLRESFAVGDEHGQRVLLGAREAPSGFGRTLLGRPSPMVGRAHELAALRSLWDACLDEGAARVAVVTGPAGIGKSRLIDAFVEGVHRGVGGARVLLGRAELTRRGAPFGVLASALRSACGVRDDDPADVARDKVRALGGPHDARARVFLGELMGVRFDDGETVQLAAARRDARLMGDQMRHAWEDWLRAESEARPVLLVLEDLHWGDLPSVQFIDGALRALRDRCFVVVAAARPDVDDAFPALWRDRGAQEVRLGALGARACEKLVRAALGDEVPASRVAGIVERAGGNPFDLEELVRAEADGRGAALPGSVLAMVEARVEAMEPAARQVLRAASVFGGTFRAAGVRALVGDGPGAPDVVACLDALERREVVRRADGDAYAFAQSSLREAAYGSLLDDDRALGHRLAAAWLEAAGVRDALALADHFERGGLLAQAADRYADAAAHALEGNDLDATLAHAARSIACGASGETLGAVRARRASVYKWRGDAERAADESVEALRLLPRGNDAWCMAAREYAAVSGNRGDTVALTALATALCEGDPPASGARVVAAVVVAIHLTLSSHAAAGAVYAWLERAASQVSGDPIALGSIDELEGFRAMLRGDTAACMLRMTAAAERHTEAGDMRGACVVRVNAAFAAMELGGLDVAEHALRDVLSVAAGHGLAVVEAHARQNLVPVLTRRGVRDEALALARSCVETYHAWHNPRPEGTARMYLAEALSRDGALDEAERELRAALTLLADVPTKRALVLAVLSGVRRAQGALDDALSTAREAMALLDGGGVDEGEAQIRLSLVEALVATGDPAARDAARSARVRLLERAACITDAAWRERFVTGVAENARTLALADALLAP